MGPALANSLKNKHLLGLIMKTGRNPPICAPICRAS
jgi:hypothetical protein